MRPRFSPVKAVPYPSDESGPVDQWSLDVFSQLKDRPLVREGSWSRWVPGYLLLEITSVAGMPIEPALLYTADEDLTVAFGLWEHHFAQRSMTPADAAESAMALIERWTSGDIKILVFTDATGKWSGSIPVSEGDLNDQLAHSQGCLMRLASTEAELRSARRHEWRRLRLINGRLTDVR